MSKIRTQKVVFFILPPKLITIIYYFNYYFIIFLRRPILDLKFPLIMKKKLDEATSLLERNHINLPESFRRRDQQDREPQHERGHSLMVRTSKSKHSWYILELQTTWWLKETPSHFWRPENPFPSTWEMTPQSYPKDKVL